ncbi:MAG: glycosyltransferase family 39 protein [Nitrososphaerota archaeon]|nr:glycosyltransferase family 39 protein [Nitrososphaerota archaeon]
MEVTAPNGRPVSRSVLRYLLAGTFVSLGVLLMLVFLHALLSLGYLVSPIYAVGGVMAALAGASALYGAFFAWRVYPQHRKATVFVVAITLATLIAHAYVIGSPSASSPTTFISGAVGSQLVSSDRDNVGNPQVTITSSLTGNVLQVTVNASGSASNGGKAIIDPQLVFPAQASGSGFSPSPTLQSPLEPGSSVTGTWTVTGNVSLISVSYSELDCYKVASPAGYGCIMDEVYYIPAGMGILNGQQCSTGPGAPSDCHLEHPFIVPALIAGGMAIFGQFNVAGWRLMPALLGTFSIPLLFGIAWKLSESKKVAAVAATLFALDVMFFAQSSAGVLDVPEVFFALAAFFAYFADLKWWKFDRYVIAGVLMAASGLSKETAVFLAAALVSYIMFFGEGDRWTRLYRVLEVTLAIGIVFAVGMQAYDSTLATSVGPFTNQIGYILSYGSSLTTGCPWACGWTGAIMGGYITPFDWFVYYSPVTYFVSHVETSAGQILYVGVGYYGITNLLETWTTFIWVPLMVWALAGFWRARRTPKEPTLDSFKPEAQASPPGEPVQAGPLSPSPEARFAGFTIILFAWSYVPYIALFLAGRVTYPFYEIPAIPAVALGGSYWLTRKWFPKWLMVVYLVFVFGFFLVYFPDKAFLPVWARELLRH